WAWVSRSHDSGLLPVYVLTALATAISQMPTKCVVGLKSFSQATVSNLKQGQLNPFFIGFIFVCVTVIYFYSPYLSFCCHPDYPPKAPPSPELSPQKTESSPTPTRKDTPPTLEPKEPLETPAKTLDVDYLPLQNLLASKKFKEADRETLQVMLLVANREREGWLDVKNIDNFSGETLRRINQLWVDYSNGNFGFSVQKQVWVSVGGQTGVYDVVVADRFIKRVGWGDKKYKSVTYKLSTPSGHLPWEINTNVWDFGVPYLAKRLESCNISE
ncbi:MULTISPECIES: GUN4 domain-containing protein, partial [unclassified Microcoleus]|uniref:GUN4 domain-containing protein n=1 Tax=unclassified Microcoleus TaxID=2642155 RepID=UPI002FCF6C72